MTTLTFDLSDFGLVDEGNDSKVKIFTCKEDYRAKVSSAELGLIPFKDEKEKKNFLNNIPACFFPVYVYCYLDGNFSKRTHAVIRYSDENSFKKPQKITLSGTYSPDDLYGPSDCNINPRVCFQSYITVISECGALCVEDIGVSTVDLNKITNKSGKTLHLKMHTVEGNPIKSKIHLTNVQLNKENAVKFTNDHQKREKVHRMIQDYEKHTEKVLSTQFYEFMENSDKISCYLNPSQVTFDNTSISMPVASYLLCEPLETDLKFWKNELEIAITRHSLQHGTSMSNFEDTFSKMSLAEQCSFGMNMIVQYPQMLEYIGDYVINTKRNGKDSIEIFGDAIALNSGDCEDLTLANIQCFESFLKMDFSKDPYYKLFSKLQEYFKFYVPFLMIEGVTANNLNNGTKKGERGGSDTTAPCLTGAHGACKFIPYKLLVDYLTRWDAHHSFTQHVKSERLAILKNFTGEEPTEILIGEGTGLLESGVFKDRLLSIRQFVYRCPLLEKVKKPIIPQQREISPFYQALLFGFTHRFIKSCGIGLFHFGTLTPYNYYNNTKKSDLWGRGVTFSDFIKQRDNVVLCPNILKTQTREYSDDLICIMNSVAKTRIPTPTLNGFSLHNRVDISIFDTKTIEKIESKASVLEKQAFMVDHLTPVINHHFAKEETHLLMDFVKAFDSNRNLAKKMKYVGTIYFYMLEDYVDPVFIQGLKDFFIHQSFDHLVGDVKISREYHTNLFYVYRCELLIYK